MNNKLLAKLVFLNGTPLKPYILDTAPTQYPKYNMDLLFLFNGGVYKIVVVIKWILNEKYSIFEHRHTEIMSIEKIELKI